MEHLATLSVANQWCDDYMVDREKAATIAMMAELELKRGPDKEFYSSKVKEYEAIMGEHGATAFCTVAYKQFGPGGNISGLMMRK